MKGRRDLDMSLTFGEKIKNLREDRDINQTQLGKAIGTTQRKISYIECNRYEPSIDDIISLCNFFKISSDYLLGIDPNYDNPDLPSRKIKRNLKYTSNKER